MKMKNVKEGQKVIVYDCCRFGIPVRGIVTELLQENDTVLVLLTTTNHPANPVGSSTWVFRQQIRLDKENEDGKNHVA